MSHVDGKTFADQDFCNRLSERRLAQEFKNLVYELLTLSFVFRSGFLLRLDDDYRQPPRGTTLPRSLRKLFLFWRLEIIGQRGAGERRSKDFVRAIGNRFAGDGE